MKQKAIMTIIGFLMLSINAVGQDIEVISPVPIDSITYVYEYGYYTHPIRHIEILSEDIEYKVSEGTDIYSITDGKVIFVGLNNESRGWGQVVDIQVNDTIIIKYAHLSKILVKKGQAITKRQVVGLYGNTGRSTAPHLGMRVELNGETINPRDIYNLPKKN